MKYIVFISLFTISFSASFFIYLPSPQISAEAIDTQLDAHFNEQPDGLSQSASPILETPSQASEQTLNAAIELDELSLQELALLVDSPFFDNTPWLSAKAADALAKYDFLQLQDAYQRLLNSKIKGSDRLLNLIVKSMAAHSSIDTLDFLLSRPAERITSRHFSQVFNDASASNATEIAEWVLSKNYYADIEDNENKVAAVFEKVAEQSPSLARSYLPRAHIHLKQHILYGLMDSFDQYQQFEALVVYMSANEHKVLNQLVINSMASQYPAQTAQWLASRPDHNYAESVYKSIFIAQVEEDFTSAANWYFQNSPDSKQSIINTVLFRGHDGTNQDTLLTWAQNLPIEYSSYAIGDLLSWLVAKDIDFVLQHYNKVQDKGQRYRISTRAFNEIQREAPEFLDEFIAQSEFSKELLEKLAWREANGL